MKNKKLVLKISAVITTAFVLFFSGFAFAKTDLTQLEEEFVIVNKQLQEFNTLKEGTLKRFAEEEKEKRLNLCLVTKTLAQAKENAHISGEQVLLPEDLKRVQSKTKWSCF